MSSSPARLRADFRLFTEVAIIDQLLTTRLERSLPPGLSRAQFGVLNHFARRSGAESPAQLASAFQVTKGAMTNSLQRLEAKGYVRVEGDETDGRRKRVSLTPEGRAAHEDAVVRLKPMLDSIRRDIPGADFEAALPFLERLRAWLDANR